MPLNELGFSRKLHLISTFFPQRVGCIRWLDGIFIRIILMKRWVIMKMLGRFLKNSLKRQTHLLRGDFQLFRAAYIICYFSYMSVSFHILLFKKCK